MRARTALNQKIRASALVVKQTSTEGEGSDKAAMQIVFVALVWSSISERKNSSVLLYRY